MGQLHDLLIVEKSMLAEGLWRFGRADESRSVAWGLITTSEHGGYEMTQSQGDVVPWRDDSVVALCLVARQPDVARIEHDLSSRPMSEPVYKQRPLFAPPPEPRMTLGELAEARRAERGAV